MSVVLNRLVTAINRLAHAIEALVRFELMADRARQESDDANP